MDAAEVLDVINQMAENHIVPDIIYGMDMIYRIGILLLFVHYLLRDFHFFEMLALYVVILVHPFE